MCFTCSVFSIPNIVKTSAFIFLFFERTILPVVILLMDSVLIIKVQSLVTRWPLLPHVSLPASFQVMLQF